jgi:hypothetical protein
MKLASINLRKLVLSPTGSINLGFILREDLLLCPSYLPLGVPNWAVIYMPSSSAWSTDAIAIPALVAVLGVAVAWRSPIFIKIALWKNLCAVFTSSSMFDVSTVNIIKIFFLYFIATLDMSSSIFLPCFSNMDTHLSFAFELK